MPTKDGVFGAPRGSCVMWIILKMVVLVGNPTDYHEEDSFKVVPHKVWWISLCLH